MQSQGDATISLDSETSPRAHFARRSSLLDSAVKAAQPENSAASFITWLMILCMPLDVSDLHEALEVVELVLEETEEVEDPFGELALAYEGFQHGAEAKTEYPQAAALKGVEAWLT